MNRGGEPRKLLPSLNITTAWGRNNDADTKTGISFGRKGLCAIKRVRFTRGVRKEDFFIDRAWKVSKTTFSITFPLLARSITRSIKKDKTHTRAQRDIVKNHPVINLENEAICFAIKLHETERTEWKYMVKRKKECRGGVAVDASQCLVYFHRRIANKDLPTFNRYRP